MKKTVSGMALISALLLIGLFSATATPVKVNDEVTELTITQTSHTISVGTLVEEQWEHPNVTKVVMTSSPGEPGTDFENRTLEGGIFYLVHDGSFLYILADSIACKQQMRLDYAQIAFDVTHDKKGTSNTDMYFFTVFGANHVYFSQQVLYNASIDEETGEVHGFDVSYCHNMPPQGLTPPLQMWGFYQSTWNEETPHEVFTFKIPLTSFNENFPDEIVAPEMPLTMGLEVELYKSITNDEDADPVGGPFISWPAEANFSDQATWGTITLSGEYKAPEESSPGFMLPVTLIAFTALLFYVKRKRTN